MPRSELQKLADALKEVFPFAYVFSSPKLHLDNGNEHAIGLVIQPGSMNPRALFRLLSNPVQVANAWGHTALYVREKGSIVKTIGFDPHRLRMFNLTNGLAGVIASGRGVTEGVIYDEDMMFTSPDMICVEFPVPAKFVRKVLKNLQSPGHSDKHLTQYVTRGGTQLEGITFDPQKMGNCINYVNMVLKKAGLEAIQGRVAPLILNPMQGKLTLSALQSEVRLRIKGQPHIHEGELIRMPMVLQASRRGVGVMKTISFGKVVMTVLSSLSATVGLTRATSVFAADIVLCTALLLEFLLETVPADSWFWKLPVRQIEGILEAGGTMAMVYTFVSGDPYAWYQGLMSFMLLVGCLFI